MGTYRPMLIGAHAEGVPLAVELDGFSGQCGYVLLAGQRIGVRVTEINLETSGSFRMLDEAEQWWVGHARTKLIRPMKIPNKQLHIATLADLRRGGWAYWLEESKSGRQF